MNVSCSPKDAEGSESFRLR